MIEIAPMPPQDLPVTGEPARAKRVLIVSYHFPPEPAAGALRPSYLARYLPEFGWEPKVLTERSNGAGGGVLTAPDAFKRLLRPRPRPEVSGSPGLSNRAGRRTKSLRGVARNLLLFPDRAAGWIPAGIVAALRATRRQRFDAVLSTSPPVSAHVVAYAVARVRGLPWIADYRDLWYGNLYAPKGRARASLELWLERAIRRRANAITVVHNDLLAQQDRTFGPSFGEAIPAAFDPAEWEDVDDLPPAEFRLCYAGTLYEGRRRLDLLLSAISSLRTRCNPAGTAVRVDYYGPDAGLVQRLAASSGVSDAVSCHGIVERARVLRALRRSAALLVLLDMRPETAGELGSKLFECVAARRPVIAIGPDGGAVQAFLARHQIGWYATDLAGTEAAVQAAYEAFASGRVGRSSTGIGADIFTARDVACRFAVLLDTVTNANESGALCVM